jgi:competence protein ComEC
MSEHYDVDEVDQPHVRRTDPLDAVTVALAGGCWAVALLIGDSWWLAVAACTVALVGALARRTSRQVWLWVLIASVVVVGVAGHARLQRTTARPELGPVSGWAVVVDDPQPFGAATRVILGIDGRRYEMWARGRAARLRVEGWDAGDMVAVSGTRTELDQARFERVRWQHVVGTFDADWLGDRHTGSPLSRASNRVRDVVSSASSALAHPDDTLFTGLVIGDDRNQPPEMLERFRRTGLSHLTAVSGQNVTLILTAAAPVLALLPGRSRSVTTVMLIAWFVVITRLEPSILRAGVMAGLAVAARAGGREGSPVRMLSLAVCVLIAVDPMLTESVGFQLSVGATAGVVTIGPRLAGRLHRLGPLASPVGVTLGAQIGVLIPSAITFGRLPLTGIVANLLAVPVAGAVMLLGLPLSLAAAIVPPVLPVLMFPMRLGVRWVDTVALLAERLEPRDAAVGWWAHGALTAVAGAVVGWRHVRRRWVLDTESDGHLSPHR